MDVGDLPAAALSHEADRGAEPEVDLLAVGLGAGHVSKPEGIGDVAADTDREAVRL